jgi:hypothetical protein
LPGKSNSSTPHEQVRWRREWKSEGHFVAVMVEPVHVKLVGAEQCPEVGELQLGRGFRGGLGLWFLYFFNLDGLFAAAAVRLLGGIGR